VHNWCINQLPEIAYPSSGVVSVRLSHLEPWRLPKDTHVRLTL
jgi:hypothetical protein